MCCRGSPLPERRAGAKHPQQQHDDATTQNLNNFFSQVDPAMGNPDTAAALWQQAGGAMPAPTPVSTHYTEETASEKDARLAQDKANAEVLGAVVQLHCGLLHYAALFITSPDQKGLHDDFNGWLKNAAQAYPQLGSLDEACGENGGQHHHHHNADGGAAPPPPVNLDDVKGKTMHDSVISSYLGFKAWKDKEQGNWSVRGIPDLFKAKILDPSRATPSQATLDAWDLYIAMKQADQPDSDRWTSTEYPPLQFERACDDYASRPARTSSRRWSRSSTPTRRIRRPTTGSSARAPCSTITAPSTAPRPRRLPHRPLRRPQPTAFP